MRHIRTGNDTTNNFEMEILVPYYVPAVWCKECGHMSILKNICEECDSRDVYHTLQKKFPEGYKELSNCKYNKKGRIPKNAKER